MSVKWFLAVALPALIVAAGCSSGNTSPPVFARALPQSGSAGQYIKNVVVIVQENRSLENFFAGYPGANAPTSGCAIPNGKQSAGRRPIRRVAGRSSSSSGCPSGDVSVPLQQIGFHGPDLAHDWYSSKVDYHEGKMDGFSRWGQPSAYPAYSYVQESLIAPYWDMAQQYVLADEMFPTEWGGSFTAHLTLVAGNDTIDQSPRESEVDFPNKVPDDCDSPPGTVSSYITAKDVEKRFQGPFPCFDQWDTMANVLDNAGVSWKYYATKLLDGGLWEPYEAMKYVRYGPDWSSDIIAPQTQVLKDAADGNLASVTWVSPSHADSDHPAYHSDLGPSWVASVVNAIGESSYWNSTAIVIVWDDWGGWYDNSTPPQLDYRGLGFRVPCLIISPYAKTGYVDHTQYEFGSILKFIEEVYGTGSIGPSSQGYTDGRATSLDAAFDFSQKPRAFTAIPSKYPASHFLREAPSNDPVDTQ
ncbi:MAG: alkaline phosphatase family protein [Candidatus Cybelea sp.]|jgi:phospholipase C